MSAIVIPGPFAELATDPAQLERTHLAFERAILASFGEDAARSGSRIPPRVTQAEIKRRFEILERWFRILRRELGWSLPRALDHLSAILRSELGGVPWTPPAQGRAWIPE